MKSTDRKKYNILYFADYGKNFGGAANTLLQQAVLMQQAGYHITVFFSDYLGEGLQEEYEQICRLLKVRGKWAAYQLTSQPEDIDIVCIDRNYEKLREQVVSCHPDILHSVQINPCVELISRELGIPHIMNVYQMLPDFFSITYLNVFPHYHLCDSWYWAEKWKYYLQTDSVCIRTAVSGKHQRKMMMPDQVIRFICVGAVYKEKNQLSVIKAFHKALQNGIQGKLTLCGYTDGEYGNYCIRYVEENNLNQNIEIKGFCSDMSKEYRQNHILLCGSTRESYPNAISEALANGLAVISTPVAGVPEVIEDGRNGYLSKGYSAEDIFEKIMQAWDDIGSGRIAGILDDAEKTFLENHSGQEVKDQLIRYYQYVTEDYRKRNLSNEGEGHIGINDVRDIFAACLKRFYDNQNYFTYKNMTEQKLWYLYHIDHAIHAAVEKKCVFYIWGTGRYGTAVKEMTEIFLPEISLAGFIDTKRTGRFCGHDIYSADEVLERENSIVLVAVLNGQDEVTEKLEKAGYVFNRDYFILAARRW